MDKLPYKSPQGITFSIYSTKEIYKLSVLEINNPNPFDTLEHPTYGGLYDPHLGPNDREELCETCGLTSFYCPGHVGHISLPLPVFNPLFTQTLYQLLRGTCFNCHRLLAPISAVHLALYQFQALDYGLVETVQELGEALTDPSLTASGKIGSAAIGLTIENKLKSIISKATAGLDLEESKSSARVKNVVECRQRIMKKFIKEHLMGAKGKCPHCGEKKSKIALRLKSRFVFTSGKVKNNVRIKPHSRLDSEDEEEFNDNIETEAENVDQSNVDLSAIDAQMHLNLLWMNDRNLLEHLFGILYVGEKIDVKSPMNMFFMEAILVPPSRFRPLAVVKGRKYLNPQSAAFKDVVQDSVVLRNLLRLIKNETINEVDQEYINRLKGKTNADKMSNMWQELQRHINIVFDSDFDKLNKDKVSSGVKQILEKKEGLFRKHMMGKRVNFSARSVISPDPYIMVDEIGVPTIFAKKLTYCQPVNHWNVQKLRAAVLNGPDVHPGAEKVENGDGSVTRLSATDPVQRHAIACKLLTPSLSCHGSSNGDNIKKVHRHLENGDVLLLNRQPTLHKPSIMAHRARVLPGEKTLRLHYANCKAYNADFDGDEMNLHFPQTEHSRSEGYNLTSVNQQYLVPKDGTPLSGLIQDHIIAGTLLTMRGRFFTREDYYQLLYCAISFVHKRVKTLPPCIIKPQKLWSGKQVVSSVIINVMPLGKPPPTVLGKAKVSAKNWQSSPPRQWKAGGTPLKDDDMSESDVIIHSGELLCGVIDKASIGPTPYGLIHCCYELYGGETSTLLLTSLARLFTHFLQIHSGFTLGIEDILLTEKATRKRQKIMKRAKKVGDEVVSQALYATDSNNKEELHEKYQEAHLSKDDTGLKTLDFEMKRKTDSFNNDINAICMPDGLMKKFPSNNLQLMIQSGAKGSTVNAMQISCLLGQIELEGRRVPLMLNGSSLPSFLPYDTSPRAGGFVDGRFLTGIRPQEYFFHCMAGREGLVDTAVKTSRSGYLQRCLIKHLEGIVVNYDMTVRDSDGSVVQFLYGEDGLDIPKIQMLKEKQFHLLAKNYNAVMNEEELKMFEAGQLSDDPEKSKKAVSKWKKKNTSSKTRGRSSGFLIFEKANSHLLSHLNQKERKSVLVQEWANLDHKEKQRFTKRTKKCPDPVNAHYRPDLVFGSVSENLDKIIEQYIKKNPHGILCHKEEDDCKDGIIGPRKFLSVEKFRRMSHYRALKALAHPGEAVGLLAAQSVGEPSTQMTLNTFHFAGRGEMNVTLGIPRLREILMVASANIATPTMELPLLDKPGVVDEAEHLKIKLSSVALKQVLETIVIHEVLSVKSRGNRFRIYRIRMNFLPYEAYHGTLYTSPSAILNYVEHFFIKRVVDKTKKILSTMSSSSFKLISSRSNVKAFRPTGVDRDEMKFPASAPVDLDGATSDEGDDGDDEDTVANKTKMRHNQDTEYENPEAGEMLETESDDDSSNEADVNIKEENEVDLNIKEEDEADIDIKEENVANINIKKEIVTDGDDDFDIESLSKKDILQNEMLEEQKSDRVKFVMDIHKWIDEYDFDPHSQQWCEFTLQLRLDGSKIDMRSLIEEEANKAIVYEIPKIKKAFLVKNPSSENGKEKMLTTEGVNFLEIFKYVDLIDANRVYSNDIHSIALIYGIEAATRVIVKEITNVFARYGIAVDPRHLMLIADYMTFDGTYKPCNRVGMESSASPLQQMTFETTMNFLKNATLGGSVDQLKSPSSRLVLGKVVSGGTGCFDLLMKNISVSGSVKRK